MARGRKPLVIPSEIHNLLVEMSDTAERKSDGKVVKYTFLAVPEDADESTVQTVENALPISKRISLLNAAFKSGPRNAAINGADENTKAIEELVSRMKKGDKAAKSELARLVASLS